MSERRRETWNALRLWVAMKAATSRRPFVRNLTPTLMGKANQPKCRCGPNGTCSADPCHGGIALSEDGLHFVRKTPPTLASASSADGGEGQQ